VVYVEMLSVAHWFDSHRKNKCVMEGEQMERIYI
jgi:hypothetical protein